MNQTFSKMFQKRKTLKCRETDTIKKHIDEKGNKMVNQYVLLQEIGRGVHGKVKLCTFQDEFYVICYLPGLENTGKES